jgi:hypothetical protein
VKKLDIEMAYYGGDGIFLVQEVMYAELNGFALNLNARHLCQLILGLFLVKRDTRSS